MLTDNQKAATFLGWKPGEPEPDVSDPRNYMKALQQAGERCYVKVIVNGVTHGRIWVRFYRGGKQKYIEGDTLVEALAALYDAEHLEVISGEGQ